MRSMAQYFALCARLRASGCESWRVGTELPPSTIRDLETGRRRTTRDRITRIAAALDIPVEALLKDVA